MLKMDIDEKAEEALEWMINAIKAGTYVPHDDVRHCLSQVVAAVAAADRAKSAAACRSAKP